MSIANAVASKRELLFEMMVASADHSLGTPDAAIRQFVGGFIQVLEAATQDDHSARDIYLSSVIPALRGGPMQLETVLAAMLRVTAATAAVLGPEHLRWVAEYCSDYTLRLMAVWNAKP
jgi:hypothetical protein